MRGTVTVFTTITTFLYLAVPALANEPGGAGTWGEADDKVVTFAGFILIAFFPLLAFVLSAIQGRLERRKDDRLEAKKAREARSDLRGGW